MFDWVEFSPDRLKSPVTLTCLIIVCVVFVLFMCSNQLATYISKKLNKKEEKTFITFLLKGILGIIIAIVAIVAIVTAK